MRTFKLGTAVALVARLGLAAAAATTLVSVSGATILGCADENDPKTWVKRLDDPAQRTASIRRLEQFFEDGMQKSSNNRDDEKVKQILDVVVEPLAKQYTSGSLDEKTRKELIEALANMADPRAASAYAKAFTDFEPGKNDDDVRQASVGTMRLATAGKLTDQGLIDALWACFAKFQPSKAKSINLVQSLRDAVLAAKHPSYGPKAVEKLGATVTNPKAPDQGLDHIQFWMHVSVQLIGELRYEPGVKPLVSALMTPSKSDLSGAIRLALMRMPKEAEKHLLAALKGTDPDLAKLAAEYPEKLYVARLAEPIAYLSRPAGREALVEALAQADSDQNRTILAMSLTHFPSDAKLRDAFLAAYAKIAPDAAIPLMGGANGHAILAQASSAFYDPTLTDWVLKEINNAKGEAAEAMPPAGLDAAIKLMTSEQAAAVGERVNKLEGPAIEKEKFKHASKPLEQCKKDAACYVKFLDQPIPSTPDAAKLGAIKACWMAAVYGNDATRDALLAKVDGIKDGSVRLTLVEAIDHLAPKGDDKVAAALEKIVEADKASGNKALIAADDSVIKVALKLRSRAAQ